MYESILANTLNTLAVAFLGNTLMVGIGIAVVVIFGLIAFIIKMYRKAYQGEAIIRTGMSGTKVSFSGIYVFPVIHRMEKMDITLKTVMIAREGKDGLVCKDNMRADIRVTFFVRVNKTEEDVSQVAQSIGADRASDQEAIQLLFDAKFSEALKTVGKLFDFVDLYNSRAEFNRQILDTIGKDLNGYVLDDCAIDYLEQTPLDLLDENNILDAEGIKKITEITAREKVKANEVQRDKEKTIKKQDVEARETVLELEKQLAEKEERQKREIANIQAREQAEIDKVLEEEKQKSELARIAAEEEIKVAEENKDRQVIVAAKNKERAEAIERERVEKDRALEAVEREKIVALAEIEKKKSVEEQEKNIQDTIRERVMVEKAVVEEQEKMKDTKAFAEAERLKKVALTKAEQEAQEELVKKIKSAEAAKQAAEFTIKQKLQETEAEQEAAKMKAEAMKTLADAQAAETASKGMGEARVIEATAVAMEKKGEADAKIIESKGLAEAKVIEAKATSAEKRGFVEANVEKEKLAVEAEGIANKAKAMKALDGVGKEHEEFKLRLEKEKAVDLARINIQKEIAESQALVLAEALKKANIDIVGGESTFFEQITSAITKGKSVDRMVDNSATLTQVRDTFFDTSEGGSFKNNLRNFIDQFGLSTEEIKNLSVANVLNQMSKTKGVSGEEQNQISGLLDIANVLGITNRSVNSLGLF